MTGKKRNLLFVGLIAILGIVFLCMTKFNSRWRIKQAVKKEERTRKVWKEAPFISLTDHQKVSEAIDSIMLRGTNIHLINPKQTKSLKMQIQNCLEAYSQGDFNKFVEFRMPCGQGINTVFDPVEMAAYNLPAAEKIPGILEKIQAREAIPEPILREFDNYSTSSPMSIWKYRWLLGGLIRYKASGGRVWCTDCWTGFSPEKSWVLISDLPQSAIQFANEVRTSGIFTDPPDLKLSPPKGNNDSTPKMYAVVRLHVDTKLKVSAHPIFVVFILTTKPECWQPMSFVSCYYIGTKYMF